MFCVQLMILYFIVFCLQRGANKVPIVSLIIVALVSLLFICIGDVNFLAPIVTMPFLVTYIAVDYAYFSLAMSYDMKYSCSSATQPSHTASRPADYQSVGSSPSCDAQNQSSHPLPSMAAERMENHPKTISTSTYVCLSTYPSVQSIFHVLHAFQRACVICLQFICLSNKKYG